MARRLTLDERQQIVRRVRSHRRITEWQVAVKLVAVAPPCSYPPQISRVGEVGEDPISRPLRNAGRFGDLSHPKLRILPDHQEYTSVGRDESPGSNLLEWMISARGVDALIDPAWASQANTQGR